jgi:hypothetical protein
MGDAGADLRRTLLQQVLNLSHSKVPPESLHSCPGQHDVLAACWAAEDAMLAGVDVDVALKTCLAE